MLRFFLTLAVIVVVLAVSACSDPHPPTIMRVDDSPAKIPDRVGQVNDFADLMSDQARSELDKRLSQLKDSSGVDVMIVISSTKGGRLMQDHAMDIVNQWKLASRTP